MQKIIYVALFVAAISGIAFASGTPAFAKTYKHPGTGTHYTTTISQSLSQSNSVVASSSDSSSHSSIVGGDTSGNSVHENAGNVQSNSGSNSATVVNGH